MWRNKGKKGSTGRLIIISLALILILMGGLAFVIVRSDLFTIKKIEIAAKNITCADENQLKNSSGILGQNFFLINFKNIAGSLKDKFFCIGSINLSYVFPNQIKIEANGREAVAILVPLKVNEATSSSSLENIATPSAGESLDSYLVDNEGVIFSKDGVGENLPSIFARDLNLSLGKKPAGNIVVSLKILEKSKQFGLDVKTAEILDNFFILFTFPKVIFQLDGEIDLQIASLQLILSKAKIDLKELEFIDLRFDKPIIRFAPKKNG